ncbi:MAG: transporter [Planctomycetota bacterium]
MAIEYLVIGFYLVLLIAIGAVVKRFNKDDSDYFRNGCKGTWWLVGASAFMVQFSAWTFTGAAGAAYEAGWSVMVIFIANAAGYFLVAAVFGGWFRQMRVVTIPEAIRARFNPATQQFYAWLTVLLGLLYAAVWLSGLATFCHAVFGFDLTTIIIVIGAVVLLYSTVGGSWGVMSTDFLQTLILIPITILVAFLCLQELGGIGGLFRQIDENGLGQEYQLINEPGMFSGKNTYTFVWAAAVFAAQVIKINTVQASQRYYAVKTGNDARKAALLAGVLMLLGSLIWFIPPMTGRLMFEDQIEALTDLPKAAEASYAVVSISLLPIGLVGVMVVAMLSATMSSLDSGLNKNAAMFVRDIYPAAMRWFGIKPDPNNPRLRLAQVASFAFGVTIIGLALYFASRDDKGVFELMLDLGAMLALPLAVPMLLAMLIRKTPSWAALGSIGVGLSVSAVGFYSEDLFGSGKPLTEWLMETPFYHQPLFGGKWAFSTVVFANVTASAIGFLLTIPFWKTSSAEHHAKVDRFFKNMHTPIDFEKEVGPANDLSQLNIMGAFAIIIGVFVCGLVLLDNPMAGRLGILFVGGFVAAVGLLFVWAARRSGAKAPVDANPTT